MNKTRKVSRNRPIPEAFRGKVYLDPTYDPAFKELFDSEDALRDFLDGVLDLEGDDKIKTLRFSFDKAVLFRVPQRSKVVFDIFATTGSGRFLNVEMQRLENDFFVDRTILYKAFLVIKGRKEMEISPEFKALTPEQQRYRRYLLPETISIWICDFDLPDAKGEYRDEWALYSRHAVREGKTVPLSGKNRYIFLSVPNFTKSADEVDCAADVWLYLLNHARDGGELPDFGSGIVEDALERIRVENADDELLQAQELNMTTKEDYESWMAGKVIKARAEGEIVGESRGKAEAEKKASDRTAKRIDYLRSMGVPEEIIAGTAAIE